MTSFVELGHGEKRIYLDRDMSAQRQAAVWVVEFEGKTYRCRWVRTSAHVITWQAWGESPSAWLATFGPVTLDDVLGVS